MSSGGRLVIVSGPSGAGKTTVLERVFQRARVPLVASVSATTRPARPGERDGVQYHFLRDEEFQQRLARGDFLEACEVFGRGAWYGTLRSEVEKGLQAGKWVVLEIDVQGALAVLKEYPAAISIFLRPSSVAELERRLRRRNTETAAAITCRLERAKHELSAVGHYRYEVVNDDIEQAVNRICEILTEQEIGKA